MSSAMSQKTLLCEVHCAATFLTHSTDRTAPSSDHNQDCTICQEECSTTDPNEPALRITQCGHYFHQSCLFNWLDEHPTCPNCRTKLFDGRTKQQRRDVLLSILEEVPVGGAWAFTHVLNKLSGDHLIEFQDELQQLSRWSRLSKEERRNALMRDESTEEWDPKTEELAPSMRDNVWF